MYLHTLFDLCMSWAWIMHALYMMAMLCAELRSGSEASNSHTCLSDSICFAFSTLCFCMPQVLAITYLGSANGTGGGFYPNGVNGYFKTSTAAGPAMAPTMG